MIGALGFVSCLPAVVVAITCIAKVYAAHAGRTIAAIASARKAGGGTMGFVNPRRAGRLERR